MSRMKFVRDNIWLSMTLALFSAALLMPRGAWAVEGTTEATTGKETYTWSAELVDYDAVDGTITVKRRVEGHADIDDLASLEAGERVTLTWTGVSSAAGVRAISAGDRDELGRFMMPVDFVGTEMDGQYVSFRVPVPSDSVAKIESLEPGTWVTGTSVHSPSGWDDAVVSIRPYNDISS